MGPAVTVGGRHHGARRLRWVVAPAAATLAALAALTGAATPVHAADPEFGTPTIDATFGEGVDLTQPVTLDETPARVEVLLTFADASPLVVELPPPTTIGSTTLRHQLSVAADGHILPNTPVSARWRITPEDGDPVLGPEVDAVYADERFDWKTARGDLVTVHWYEGDTAFGERSLRIAEEAVRETSDLLGVTEDEPIDFFIYAEQDPFYDALGPGTRENVGGQANAEIRTLFALVGATDVGWDEIVVRHELVHLVFDTAVDNPYHFPPRWLNEGLAVYQSQSYDPGDRSAVESAARAGTLIPLDGLTGQFPTGDGFFLAYAESVSAVDFFIRTHDQDALVALIGSYADGLTDDEAFQARHRHGHGRLQCGVAGRSGCGRAPATRATAGTARAQAIRVGRPRRGPRCDARARRPGAHPQRGRWYRRRRAARWELHARPGDRGGGRLRRRRAARLVALPPWATRRHAVTVGARLRAIPSWQVTLGVALLGLGFLVAAQLAAEGPRVRYTTQERSPLVETASELQADQEALKTSILDLRARIQAAEQAGEGSAALVSDLNDQLEAARIAAGLIPLTGSGIVLQLEDSLEPADPEGNTSDLLVGARDLRTIVEELWAAGAEAIAVNGERMTPTTAVIDIGPSILINSAYLAGPFQVTAIGPDDLYARLSASPGFVDFIRARAEAWGLRVSIAEPESVDMPAFAGTVTLRYARPQPSPEAALSPAD